MLLVIGAINRLSSRDIRWFNRLRRPRWLTFEWAIPFIWISIFCCGAWSAQLTWQAQPGTVKTWILMLGYLLLEVVTMAYTPVMCKLRSLRVGTLIGGTGFVIGLILAAAVAAVSTPALALLIPYLLWSPIGTFVTWQMSGLNPADA